MYADAWLVQISKLLILIHFKKIIFNIIFLT
jgi:hypothetical protein